jgi:hypothetical protein
MSRATKDVVTFTGTILRETDKAVQFAIEGQTTEWFPLSQMDSLKRTNTVGEDEIVVTKWIAEKKGLEF